MIQKNENASDLKQQIIAYSDQNSPSNQVSESYFDDLFNDLNENSENEKQQHQDSNQVHSSLVSDAKVESQNNQKIVEEVKTKKENQNLPSNQVEN